MTDPSQASRGRVPLHIKVLIGFVAGALLGLLAHTQGADATWVQNIITYVTRPVGQVFLNLLFMLVIPLMFSALVLGVAELGDIASLGRLGWRTLAYTAIVTGMAVGIGLLMVNLIQPGLHLDPALVQQAMASSAGKTGEIVASGKALNLMDLLVGIVPHNAIAAAVDDKQKLGIVFFALMIGIGLVLTPSKATEAFKHALQGLFEICMRLIGLFVRLAPYAVACFMFALTAQLGWDVLAGLAWFVVTVLAALAIHMFVVLPLWVRFMGRMPVRTFFRGSQEATLMAFATASSTATLPVTLRVAEENLREALEEHRQRRLARAGAADQGDHLAGPHLQVDVAEDVAVLRRVAEADVLEADVAAEARQWDGGALRVLLGRGVVQVGEPLQRQRQRLQVEPQLDEAEDRHRQHRDQRVEGHQLADRHLLAQHEVGAVPQEQQRGEDVDAAEKALQQQADAAAAELDVGLADHEVLVRPARGLLGVGLLDRGDALDGLDELGLGLRLALEGQAVVLPQPGREEGGQADVKGERRQRDEGEPDVVVAHQRDAAGDHQQVEERRHRPAG
jgi:DAACS family dicarboxylate/amino acid:cation (Na+ or H+) symporter